jgi:hypothetical protein
MKVEAEAGEVVVYLQWGNRTLRMPMAPKFARCLADQILFRAREIDPAGHAELFTRMGAEAISAFIQADEFVAAQIEKQQQGGKEH